MKTWILAASLCLLTLGGCATQNKSASQQTGSGTATSPQVAWEQRQADFARMSSWRMQGRVGVQFREESASFGISWLQNGSDNYEMNIKNPLTGSVVAYLQGSANKVSLQANGKTYQDANAERLLQSQMGVSLPLDGMKYWIRGIPSPKSAVDAVKLDAQGRPQTLQQSGWLVEYTGWQGDSAKAMPEKINLSRASENTRVKVLAKDWQTRF